MARQIVVSGGAGYWSGPDALDIDRFVFSLTGKEKPKVCGIFTGSGDLPAHIKSFTTLPDRCVSPHIYRFSVHHRVRLSRFFAGKT